MINYLRLLFQKGYYTGTKPDFSMALKAFIQNLRYNRKVSQEISNADQTMLPEAALISCTSSAVFWISGTSFASMPPARSATLTLDADSLLISPAAVWLRSASLRTSAATTAKPLPWSRFHGRGPRTGQQAPETAAKRDSPRVLR